MRHTRPAETTRTALALAAAMGLALPAVALAAGGAPPKLDHYKAHRLKADRLKGTLTLEDALYTGKLKVNLEKTVYFGIPADYEKKGIADKGAYFNGLEFTPYISLGKRVKFTNQFGSQTWKLAGAEFVFFPASKGGTPGARNAFKCYEAIGKKREFKVNVTDELDLARKITGKTWVYQPCFFCDPVKVTDGKRTLKVQDPDQHLACYFVNEGTRWVPPALFTTTDMLATRRLTLRKVELLCVPSKKMPLVTKAVSLLSFHAERRASGVALSWRTATEERCGAFRVLRCEGPDCAIREGFRWREVARVACEDSIGGAAYEVRDRTAQAGVGYRYLLVEHETTGRVNQHGPLVLGPSALTADLGAAPRGSGPVAAELPSFGCALGGGPAGAPGAALLLMAAVALLRRRRR